MRNNTHQWPGWGAWILTLGIIAVLLLMNAKVINTDGTITEITYAVIDRIVWDVVIDSTGSREATNSFCYDSTTVLSYTGHITSVQIKPYGGTVPDSSWDIYLYDKDTLDILRGHGVNLDSNATILMNQPEDSLRFVLSQERIRVKADSLRHGNGFRITIKVEP